MATVCTLLPHADKNVRNGLGKDAADYLLDIIRLIRLLTYTRQY